MKFLIAFAVAVVLAKAQVFERSCDERVVDIEVKEGLDVERYMGRWYEISRYEQFFQPDMDCVTAQYSINDDGSVRVDNQGRNLATGENFQDIGRAVLSFPNDTPLLAKLNVTFPAEGKVSSS